MADGVTITGLEQAMEALRTLEPDQQDAAITSALRAGGSIIRDAIVEAAPVREDEYNPKSTALYPGVLKDDIKMTTKVQRGFGVAFIGPGKLSSHVARWIEYGYRLIEGGYSRAVKDKAGNKTGLFRGPGSEIKFVDPKPFIRPSFEAVKDEAQTAAQNKLLTEVIKRVKQGLPKAS